MDLEELTGALAVQIEEAEQLKTKRYDCPELSGWIAKTKALIRKANQPDFLGQFERLYFPGGEGWVGESESKRLARTQPFYEAGLTEAQSILQGLIEVLQLFGAHPPPRKKRRIGFRKEDEP